MPSPKHIHEEIKVTDIAFTSDFCDNDSHPASPASLYLTSPRPRPTRPRVPYLISPKSPHTRPDVPMPLSPSHFYTQPFFLPLERTPLCLGRPPPMKHIQRDPQIRLLSGHFDLFCSTRFISCLKA